MNRFHQAYGQRWKRAKRNGLQRFSFNWRGTFKTCYSIK